MSRTRVFYTSDIHGSERVFLKLLNSVKIYKAKVVIVGGDLSGKRLIPIIDKGNGVYETIFLGEKVEISSKSSLENIIDKIRAVGYYPYITSESMLEELNNDESRLNEVFESLIADTMRRWMKYVEEKLAKSDIRLFIMPGNDDPYVIDNILAESEHVTNPDGQVVSIDDHHEMVSLGVSNMTPWRCIRDLEEEEISRRINFLVNKIDNIDNTIFNIHVPPYGTNIDMAPKLDETLKPVLTPGGGYEMVNVGSLAVREAIENYQPKLGLHGHVHESRGVAKIGRTLCFNPGSEYTEGILRGVLLELDKNKIRDYLLIQG